MSADLFAPNNLNGGKTAYPDPMKGLSDQYFPRSMPQALRLSELLWSRDGTFREAMNRVISYFLTDVDFGKYGADADDNLSSFFRHRLNAMGELKTTGQNWVGYGNSFSSFCGPFDRFIRCKCGNSERLMTNTPFEFIDFKIMAHCFVCGKRTEHTHVDRPSSDTKRAAIKHWDVHQMLLRVHPWNASVREYFWNVDPWVAQRVKRGDAFMIAHLPWEVIESVQRNELFKFHDGIVFHLAEPALSGVRTGGWGIPRVLSSFPQAFYVAMLKRLNENLAADYAIPFRVISPPITNGAMGSDPFKSGANNQFIPQIQNMVQQHRRDPGRVQIAPHAFQYQSLGGEAKTLAPGELLTQATDEYLNGLGVAANFYRFDFQDQAVPPMIRLFQAQHSWLAYGYERQLEAWTDAACAFYGWRRPKHVKLVPVRHADDAELRGILLQLASSNLISKDTAFSPLGVKMRDEAEKALQEQYELDKMVQEKEEDRAKKEELTAAMRGAMHQQQGGGGGVPSMGAPAGSAGGNAVGIEKVQAEGDNLAQQWARMPDSARRAQMAEVRKSNPTLHAVAMKKWETMSSQMGTQGKNDMLAQMQQNPAG